jgi:hypothetical protein
LDLNQAQNAVPGNDNDIILAGQHGAHAKGMSVDTIRPWRGCRSATQDL